MRVPDYFIFSLLKEQEAKVRRQLEDKILEVSTGRKVRSISDEPNVTFNVISLKKEVAQLSQYSKNRLFSDTYLAYTDFTLGKMEDLLKGAYSNVVRAKNSATLTPQELKATADGMYATLKALLDRANDKLGQVFVFSGTDLERRPFDETTLDYVASPQDFQVWISDSTSIPTVLSGGEVFYTSSTLSKATYLSPTQSFTSSGTITITVGATTVNISYGAQNQPQSIEELASYMNASYGNLLGALVSQNPDGSYSLLIYSKDPSSKLTLSATGELSVGFQDTNVLQAVKRVADKLSSGLYPDESDLFLIERSYSTVSAWRAKVGSVLAVVRNMQDLQENSMDILQARKSDLEDADLPQSVLEYTRYRIAYEALMRIVADQKDLTILRYI
ncbi:flagellar hook-associated protein 3 [Thermocrinis albus DSM 14484]|uniref:Flagellar hook-associated protein 3 n=1 Tax=Thermocrinis albus (strain DSM 14484 / JCM 11386 / HI 11/12) TaxID=638303 RepID=D3SLV1_THEAH|nr:flagellar hook-associated protein FlgL [Thermocrinis albus]ADC89731.1 flagellar hook-associated protein 3 [Thermocrinis albus DSM 14484]